MSFEGAASLWCFGVIHSVAIDPQSWGRYIKNVTIASYLLLVGYILAM